MDYHLLINNVKRDVEPNSASGKETSKDINLIFDTFEIMTKTKDKKQ